MAFSLQEALASVGSFLSGGLYSLSNRVSWGGCGVFGAERCASGAGSSRSVAKAGGRRLQAVVRRRMVTAVSSASPHRELARGTGGNRSLAPPPVVQHHAAPGAQRVGRASPAHA